MLEKFVGLQRLFRHHVPCQLYVHCRNHRLALCIKHLIKDYPALAELDEVLIAVWKLFHYSPQRFGILEKVQETYNLPKLTFIKAVTTRYCNLTN